MKTILVTGSTDGIGLETALELASSGYSVQPAPLAEGQRLAQQLWGWSENAVRSWIPAVTSIHLVA